MHSSLKRKYAFFIIAFSMLNSSNKTYVRNKDYAAYPLILSLDLELISKDMKKETVIP